VQEDHSFLQSYKDILRQRGLYDEDSVRSSTRQTATTAQNTSRNTRTFTDEDVEKVKNTVMTLLRRHDAEGELCCCMDENNLQVVNVDANGFVTAVRCTRPYVNENCTCRVNIVETTCDDDKWSYEEVDDEVPIYKGDHICWHRPYAIWHHAIVTKVEGEEITYIHYSNNKTVEQKTVPRDELTACGSKCCCSGMANECNTLYRVNYQDCYNSEYTIMRAEKLREEKKYDLIGRNCEHFSHYCKTGSTSSGQLSVAWTSLGSVIVSFCLKLLLTLLLVAAVELLITFSYIISSMDPYEKIEIVAVFVAIVAIGNAFVYMFMNLAANIFSLYLMKTTVSRLSKVPVKPATASNTCTCQSTCIHHPRLRRLYRNVCIRSFFRSCASVTEYICCQLCNNVSCRECTCYRRQCHLCCGVYTRIAIRENIAALGSLLGLAVSYFLIIISAFSAGSFVVILLILLAGHIVGYIIGAFVGRCTEALCHRCWKCCPKTAVSTSRARNARIQV